MFWFRKEIVSYINYNSILRHREMKSGSKQIKDYLYLMKLSTEDWNYGSRKILYSHELIIVSNSRGLSQNVWEICFALVKLITINCCLVIDYIQYQQRCPILFSISLGNINQTIILYKPAPLNVHKRLLKFTSKLKFYTFFSKNTIN